MFGYVKPVLGEMLVREHEFYKATYCGICRAMKKHTGALSNVTLSYDSVFLALIRMLYIPDSDFVAEQRRCIAHPVKKRPMLKENSAIKYTARAFAVLTYHKLKDDLQDERGIKRLGATAVKPIASVASSKAALDELSVLVADRLDKITSLEKAKCESVDTPAALFGELLGEIFAFDEGDTLSKDKKICLYEIGNRLGRFIYIVDAYADIAEDQKEGKYNPFVLSGEDTNDESFTTALINALDMELAAALNALDLLSVEDPGIDSIIRNILAMGLPDVAEKVILKKEKMKTPKEPRHE